MKLSKVTPKPENRLGVTFESFTETSLKLTKVTPDTVDRLGVTFESFTETYQNLQKLPQKLPKT